jgi:hypothetical protein
VAALAALAALAPLSCKRPSEGGSGLPRPANLESSVAMGDPRAGAQLLRGFYGIEAGAWRWTARQFSAMLRTPAGAAQNGAVLEFRLTVPDPVIAKLKSVTLDASIGGAIFPPATYDKPGDYAYTAAVPAEQLAGEAVTVNFELDKAMPPNPPELRELGVVAHSVALRPRAAR